MNTANTPVSIDLDDVPAYTGIKRQHIDTAIRRGDLVCRYIGPKIRVVTLRDLDTYVNSLPTYPGT